MHEYKEWKGKKPTLKWDLLQKQLKVLSDMHYMLLFYYS